MTDEPALQTNDAATPQAPEQRTLSQREGQLQALDLGALGTLGGLDGSVVCAIDDPDCEVPAATPAGAPSVVIEALAPRNPQPSATAPTTAEA